MKSIIVQNANLENDPEGHAKMLDILKARKTEFSSSEIRDAITNYQSILSTRIGSYQADPLNNCNPVCKQDIGVTGDVNDDDEPTDPGLAAIAEEYQIQPAKSVWELLRQGDQALCGLNRFVKEYANPDIANVSKPYKPVLCDATPTGWMKLSKKTIVSYLFNEDVVD